MSRSRASYLLRFDDICPTMRWSNWEPIEVILREHNIRPIMAVVPDNRDPGLYYEAANPQFWNRVRSWQAAGWTIGIHGFQHTYLTRRPGLYSHRPASEFAGLPRDVQREKLVQALAALDAEGVNSNLWVAPGHSFDHATVSILRELGINYISDGFTNAPYTDKNGIFWIPQQLSERHILRTSNRISAESRSAGVWTVCCHMNAWSGEDIDDFRRNIGYYGPLIRTVDEVHTVYGARQMNWLDRAHVARLEIKRLFRLLRFFYENRSGRKQPPYRKCETGPVGFETSQGKDQ